MESTLTHPDGLNDLEDGRTHHNEDEKSQQLGRDRIAVVLLGGLGHVASLGDVLGVLLVGLAHAGCGGHLE